MAKKNTRQLREKRERNQKKNIELRNQRKKQNIIKAAVTAAIAVVLIAALSIGISAYLDSGSKLRSKNAITSDSYEINNAMMSYYLYKNINAELDNYGYYYQYYYNLSLTDSLKEQLYNEEMTWFDYFLTNTANEISTVLLLAENAKENGMTLDADELAEIDETISDLEIEAEEAGKTLNKYIASRFGRGVKESDIREALEIYNLAFKNYEAIIDSFTYTDAELDQYYDEHTTDFLYVDYKYYIFDDEAAANKAAAATTADEFEAAVKEYLKADTEASYTENELKEKLWDTSAYKYSYNTSDEFGAWAFADGRKAGDTTVVAESTGKYSAYYMVNPSHRLEETKNVRHILVKFDNYDTAADALVQANMVFEEYLKGEQTEAAFEALAEQYNEDSGSLYEDIRPGDMVAPFNDWCYAEERKVGDVEVVESEFGYHIIYFVGNGETAWKVDAKEELTSDSYADLLDEYAEKYPINFFEKNMYKIPGDVATK